MKALLNDVVRLFYPAICCGCGTPLVKNETVLCLGCEIKLPRTEFLVHPENPVEKIFWGRLPINHASAFLYFRKTGLTQRLIHQLKYKQNKDIGHRLGYLYGLDMLSELKKMAVDGI